MSGTFCHQNYDLNAPLCQSSLTVCERERNYKMYLITRVASCNNNPQEPKADRDRSRRSGHPQPKRVPEKT